MEKNFTDSEKASSGERARHIQNIVRALESSEFQRNAMSESMGGNAGEGRLAVNAFADIETGEVILFGNIQDIRKEIRDNPKYAEVTFICALDIKQPNLKFVRVISGDPLGFGRKISGNAMANLEEAVKLANGGR